MPADEPAAVRLEGPADGELLDAVHEGVAQLWASAPHVPDTDRMLFEIALVEVVANVVQHAVPAADHVHVAVDLTADDGAVHAEVIDDGAATPVDLDRGLPADTATSGRGLALIQRTVDRFTFERTGDQNVWRLARGFTPEG
ncbi:ATP-binding protein [Puerhibacterium puerhi]|uniref:ATP-binding protein n=1 Tax=Puerhibacterium puerhi TaxID=2692623 RepID=UPI001358D14A|nr:ATP-binding protein [Puerhibacterium puerhi]